MVEWLEWDCYGAEGSGFESRLGQPRTGRLKKKTWSCHLTLLCSNNPATNGYLFWLGRDKAAKRDGWLRISLWCAQVTDSLILLSPYSPTPPAHPRLGKDKAAKGERWLRISYAQPKLQWVLLALLPIPPSVHGPMPWETVTYFFTYGVSKLSRVSIG